MTRRCIWAVMPALLAASLLFASPATAPAPAPATAPATAPASGPACDEGRVDSWDVSRLGRTRLGEVWSGPKLGPADLRGKVVLLEFWGYNCPPCIRSMPHLNQLQNRYRANGLVVIGAHVGASAREKALDIVKRTGVTYTILSGAFVPGIQLTHIPVAMVFDGKGTLLYQGAPNAQMDRAVAGALTPQPRPAED